MLNITTPGGRVIATTTKATNVVTVNPKTLHLTAVKSGSGSTTGGSGDTSPEFLNGPLNLKEVTVLSTLI